MKTTNWTHAYREAIQAIKKQAEERQLMNEKRASLYEAIQTAQGAERSLAVQRYQKAVEETAELKRAHRIANKNK
tara:strand:+ start:963 stop:1187 length:225 start_codon:yes stop_codon:yes gene_type:complete